MPIGLYDAKEMPNSHRTAAKSIDLTMASLNIVFIWRENYFHVRAVSDSHVEESEVGHTDHSTQ